MALPIGLQNVIFDEFLALVETRVAAAREAGTLDIGVETMLVETATVKEDILLRTDALSGATSHLLTVEVTRRRHLVSLERILRLAASDTTALFMHNARSGKVALRTRARSAMTDDGKPVPRVEMMRPTRREYLREDDLCESAWERCSPEQFCAHWTAEVEDAANRLDTETIRLATGLLLSIWSALPSDYLVVNRIVDEQGRSWLGRLVFAKDVGKLLKDLGVEGRDILSASETVEAVYSGASIALTHPHVCELKRARVNRSTRIETVGAPAGQLLWFKSLGYFTKIIQYRTRLFVPIDQAKAIMGTLMRKPVEIKAP